MEMVPNSADNGLLISVSVGLGIVTFEEFCAGFSTLPWTRAERLGENMCGAQSGSPALTVCSKGIYTQHMEAI